jgi:hypothetical protein
MIILPVLSASAVVFALAMSAGGQTPPGQKGGPTHPASTPPSLVALHERAKAARSNDPSSVRAVVDAIFDSTDFQRMPESVRDRLTRADLAHRKGQHDGVKDEDIANAMNSVARLYGITGRQSSFGTTSVGQIQRYRRIARAMVPFIGAEGGRPSKAESRMSPTEAMYLVTRLLTQQLYNPDYKVSPEEWCHRYDERHRAPAAPQTASHSASHSAVGQIADDDTIQISRALETLSDEGGAATTATHMFLDKLGIDR